MVNLHSNRRENSVVSTRCTDIDENQIPSPYESVLGEVYPIYPTPPLGQDMTQGQFFKRSLTGLNSEFLLLLD